MCVIALYDFFENIFHIVLRRETNIAHLFRFYDTICARRAEAFCVIEKKIIAVSTVGNVT